MTEELKDVLKHIKNYADLSPEEKQKALESIYSIQWHSSHARPIAENKKGEK
jgi:DNA-directed RNA polymerase subunit F